MHHVTAKFIILFPKPPSASVLVPMFCCKIFPYMKLYCTKVPHTPFWSTATTMPQQTLSYSFLAVAMMLAGARTLFQTSTLPQETIQHPSRKPIHSIFIINLIICCQRTKHYHIKHKLINCTRQDKISESSIHLWYIAAVPNYLPGYHLVMVVNMVMMLLIEMMMEMPMEMTMSKSMCSHRRRLTPRVAPHRSHQLVSTLFSKTSSWQMWWWYGWWGGWGWW